MIDRKSAMGFARWLRVERSVIGEEVDLDTLYDQWTDDEPSRYCNHDPAALTTAEISVCECGALIDSDTGRVLDA